VLTSYAPPFTTIVDSDSNLAGGHAVALWEGLLGQAGSFRLQGFYDRTRRDELTFKETRQTGDIDWQHSFSTVGQEFVWGAGYRVSSGTAETAGTLVFTPPGRTDHLVTAFVRDEFTLVPERWRISFGTKLEHNAYSGFEWQPSGRVIWTPSDTHTVVGSIARAVRTPSRVERDFETAALIAAAPLPTFVRLLPNPAFTSEKLVAAELGYRLRLSPNAFLSAATFFNRHDDVLSTEVGGTFVETEPPPARLVLPIVFGNGLEGESYGLETATDIRLGTRTRWTVNYSWLRVNLRRQPGSNDGSQERRGEGIAPRHQASMTWSFDLPRQWFLDWTLRYVPRLRGINVPGYSTSDVRLGWLPRADLEIALVGRNLHDARHLEFEGGATGNTEIRRSAFVTATWRR
jgi:iron complex outermembrane receptor protein